MASRDELQSVVAAMVEQADAPIEQIPTPLRTYAVQALMQEAPRAPMIPFDVARKVEAMFPREVVQAWLNPLREAVSPVGEWKVVGGAFSANRIILCDTTAGLYMPIFGAQFNLLTIDRETKKPTGRYGRMRDIPAIRISEDERFCLHYTLRGKLLVNACADLEFVREQADGVLGLLLDGEFMWYALLGRVVYAKIDTGEILKTYEAEVSDATFFVRSTEEGKNYLWIYGKSRLYTIHVAAERITRSISGERTSVIDVRANKYGLATVAATREGRRVNYAFLTDKHHREFKTRETCTLVLPVSREIFTCSTSVTTSFHDIHGGQINHLHITVMATHGGEVLVVDEGNKIAIWKPRWRMTVQQV